MSAKNRNTVIDVGSIDIAGSIETSNVRILGSQESSIRALRSSEAELNALNVRTSRHFHPRSVCGYKRREVEHVKNRTLNQLQNSERSFKRKQGLVRESDSAR